ncbi:MAG: endopeptidase La [Clostridia bacterium]|nr:endopeptidase La [Clostridia bacterium]
MADKHLKQTLPLLPLRGMVVFPYMILNFDVGREKSVKALEAAMAEEQEIFLAAQNDIGVDEPTDKDIYAVGTIAQIKQIMKLPGKVVRVLIEGQRRARMLSIVDDEPFMSAEIEELEDIQIQDETQSKAFVRRLQQAFEEYFSYNPRINTESFISIMSIEQAGQFADVIASNVNFALETKQKILECVDVCERIETLIVGIKNELEVLKVEKQIDEKVKAKIDKNQKEYYLREQARVIQEELGDKEGLSAEIAEYRKKIDELKMPKEVKTKLLKEVDRLSKMHSSSSELGVIRNYLDYVTDLPWGKKTKERFDIRKAEEILNADHYGLEKVKERVLEYLAVRKFAKSVHGPILCFVGPPGVGKTSIAKSIAASMGRKYVRISLGGIHDEADIRGHRKTYIGAMPGRIMTAIRQAGSKNPLMLLDEIDKMGSDYRGDPSAALLEVLDAEQNFAFRDHYLEGDFDLSDVLFVTTANTLDTVPRPLLDRMEVIEITGYTEEEKVNIAQRYLIPKQLEKNGLSGRKIAIEEEAIRDIINYYTHEAGVRGLEREIENLCRKMAKSILYEKKRSITITSKTLETYIGKKRYRYDPMNDVDEVGVARGLAWTQAGGDTLSIEVNVMHGTGQIELTGKLGEVMKESAKAAISFIRSRAEDLGIDVDFYKTKDIHIHVPEGAVPKDGPSAGITMATALISALTGCPVRKDVAMTGEITLRGRVLPIGGLKEKVLAAYRAGIRTVIIPIENKKDINDIPKSVRDEMKFVAADMMDTVLKSALVKKRVRNSKFQVKDIDISIPIETHENTGLSIKQ